MNKQKYISTYSYEIKKSKYIGFLYSISSVENVNEIYNYLKQEYKKATHICYGYLVNNGIEIKIKGFDDGEPKGTASTPILNAIDKFKLSNVCLFVIRYFGGTKLGAGGLYRSYTKVAFETIKLSGNN